jgi:putative ABC transport system ATP-binding protein
MKNELSSEVSMSKVKSFIRLEAVNKDYVMGEVTVRALKGLELEVSEGEFAVLLGPSGCGKTTTLNLIGGLDQPTQGRVIVQGKDIAGYNERQLTAFRREEMGFIFQFFNLIPTLTARENVEFALALHKNHKDIGSRALELLEMVGLRNRSDHFPSQLSGGEQQRVAIARALANRSQVILCDEPTGNLDIGTGQQVLRVISEMNRERGATVVLVTHNTAIAPIANRVVHIRNGSVERVDINENPADVSALNW